jgi:hypothetical protein
MSGLTANEIRYEYSREGVVIPDYDPPLEAPGTAPVSIHKTCFKAPHHNWSS